MDFERFDKEIDLEGLKRDIETSGTGDFEELPDGDYEVSIERLELSESNKGRPMVRCWMKVVAGESKGRLMFYNMVVERGFQVHQCNEFLDSLKTSYEVRFESYSDYATLIEGIFNEIKVKGTQYAVKKETVKNFPRYTVIQVFE